MTKKELKQLDALLAKYQQYVDAKYMMTPAFEIAMKLRAFVEKDINA